MEEQFLHFVWQFQYFEKGNLSLTNLSHLQIISVGLSNKHSGPDFYNSKVIIDTIEWFGCIEIHVKSSEWYEHHHHNDKMYDNVILHVVWEEDQEVYRKDGSKIPTLVLKDIISQSIFEKYTYLVSSQQKIACQNQFIEVNRLARISMQDKALMKRLEDKADRILDIHYKTNQDWEETIYRVLAQGFGFKVNQEPFLQLASSIPYKLIRRHSHQLIQIEAMFYGLGGFLEDTHEDKDEYFQILQREYDLLKHKYQLQGKQMERHQWKFLRMRPANFPTIRIAQFVYFVSSVEHFFSRLLAYQNMSEIQSLFQIIQSSYWQNHYDFMKEAKQTYKGLGNSSIDVLIINTVVPILVAYGREKDQNEYINRAVQFLEQMKPEKNHILDLWKETGFSIKSAFDSQSALELYNNFCSKKRCLHCEIGVALVRK